MKRFLLLLSILGLVSCGENNNVFSVKDNDSLETSGKFEVYEWGVITGRADSKVFDVKTALDRYMETMVDKPVIYFYADEKVENVSLSVEMKDGTPKILLPEADTSGSVIRWNDFTVFPTGETHTETLYDIYKNLYDFEQAGYEYNFGALRSNDASYLAVPQKDRVDSSNYLFYEGSMPIENIIVIETLDSVNKVVTIKNAGNLPVSNVYYTYIERVDTDSTAENFYYVINIKNLDAQSLITDSLKYMGRAYQNHRDETIELYKTNAVYDPYYQPVVEVAEFTPSLTDMMMSEGFGEKESKVFEDYWRAEFFSEVPYSFGWNGYREIVQVPHSTLVYMLSQEKVEAMLPMTISHTPTKLKRAIFVRILD